MTYHQKSTQDLIDTYQNVDLPNREEAFSVLVLRFRQDLLNFCEMRCRKFGQSHEVAEEIVFKTFESYAKKPGFDLKEAKGKTDDDSFIIYLAAIAKNNLTDFYRIQKRKEEGNWSDGSEVIITELPKLPTEASLENQIVYKVLCSLPYSHKVIYLTYKSYENAGCNLPRKLLKELREHLGIEQGTIRTYKKETLDKISIALLGLRALESDLHENG
ncbi:RNA polymerase sigma factor (sigma-70 family) [Roseivirga ehrenbergii]|uniref:Uncharacterized protein n=1 Tax=Roseivirga ehrenbergii (strain DSM 102268 / JCM 13514 / KCTC 12282 / NCIMB 14502 / KMM 6017) TaxID=279360 RepID=A0A150XSA7_ROSEK|nr:sigma-70 family RNA polymerase sigma factor [Roseivirga ehrenbergii]KYG81648.1 hypothetical protein MB14_13785 [Roseivirga ehrenbergii]TCL10823.1 RNA polymerase sigma factor (sigma-70 family) [Roseivirga ehrenbergii]